MLRDKKNLYSKNKCPKKKFWTKQKTITPPPFKLNGRSLNSVGVEEGFCVFRNGLISISDLVFGNVWSCSTLYNENVPQKWWIKKIKKKGGGVHKSGTYDVQYKIVV
jgi:hypothetical protein